MNALPKSLPDAEPFTSEDIAEILADYEWRECSHCAGTGATEPDGKTCAPCDGEGAIRVKAGAL